MFAAKAMMGNDPAAITGGSAYYSSPGTYTYQSAYPTIPALSQRYLKTTFGTPASNYALINPFNSTGWTLEYWLYPTSTLGMGEISNTTVDTGFSSGPTLANLNSAGILTSGWGFGPIETRQPNMFFQYRSGSPGSYTYRLYWLQVSTVITLNAWNNLAVTFSPVGDGSFDVRAFVNGGQKNVRYFPNIIVGPVPSYTSSVNIIPQNGTLSTAWATNIVTGLNGSGQTSAGYIDELRISNIARYTSGYTPATSPFVTDSNTQLLLQFNGANGSTNFIDSSGLGRTTTNNGQLNVTIANPNSPF